MESYAERQMLYEMNRMITHNIKYRYLNDTIWKMAIAKYYNENDFICNVQLMVPNRVK